MQLDASLYEYREKLSEFVAELVDLVGHVHGCFRKDNAQCFIDSERLSKLVQKESRTFTQEIIKAGDTDQMRFLLSLSVHVERFGEYAEKMIRTLHTKSKEGIVFSDKAIGELNILLGGLVTLLGNAKDLVTTFNAVLADHAITNATELNAKADEFAALHEARLLGGSCNPKNSRVYLDTLDDLRMCVWHVKEMARKIKQA